LADAASQRELAEEVEEEAENDLNVVIEAEIIAEESGPMEEEDGLIVNGFCDDEWGFEEENERKEGMRTRDHY
jgi:hypothetical protein